MEASDWLPAASWYPTGQVHPKPRPHSNSVTGPQRPPHTLRGLAKTRINTLFINGPSRAFVQEEPGVEVGRGTLV